MKKIVLVFFVPIIQSLFAPADDGWGTVKGPTNVAQGGIINSNRAVASNASLSQRSAIAQMIHEEGSGTMVNNGTMIHNATTSGTVVNKNANSYKPGFLNKPVASYQHPWTGNDTLKSPNKVSQSISERVQALTKSQNVSGGITKPTSVPNKLSAGVVKLFGAKKTPPNMSSETFIPRTKVNKNIPLEPIPENIAKDDAQAQAALPKIELPKATTPLVTISNKVVTEEVTTQEHEMMPTA